MFRLDHVLIALILAVGIFATVERVCLHLDRQQQQRVEQQQWMEQLYR